MINFKAECAVTPGDMLYFARGLALVRGETYVEISTDAEQVGLHLSKEDLIRLRDTIDRALSKENNND